MPINKVAVIGSGVMGGGIAAHVANAGVPVLLLDIVPAGAKNRNVVAAVPRTATSSPKGRSSGCSRPIRRRSCIATMRG